MKPKPFTSTLPTLVSLLAVLLSTSCKPTAPHSAPSKPNIIFILADDLGYGDLGCYGQRIIKTPRLDQMAAEGMKFSQFYAGATVCAPSRSVLMTGRHLGHTRVRGNTPIRADQSLHDEDVTIAEVLKKAGYATAAIGKWGIGEEGTDGQPWLQGFDLFYGYLNQLAAHNYYPPFLWRNGKKDDLKNEVDLIHVGKEPRFWGTGGIATKKVEYSQDLFMKEALNFIDENKDDPFFLYMPITIPHANNEAGRKLGDGQEVPDYGIYADKDWPNPDKGQAAMITRMDTGIGQILDRLKELGIDENTVVMFSSDNGPHDEGGHDTDRFNPSGPLRGIKRDLYEGGIRVPLIVRWPGVTPAGTSSDHIGYFGDLMATASELAGTDPSTPNDSISFVATIKGDNKEQKEHPYLYWEFYERGSKQAIRMRKWKGVRLPGFTGKIELYNLETDLGEANDIAADHPEVVAKMEASMKEAHTPAAIWKPGGKPAEKNPKPGHGKKPF